MTVFHAFGLLAGRVSGAICAGLLGVGLAAVVAAHEGESHGTPPPEAGIPGGPVTLSPRARENLDLQTAPVVLRRLVTGPAAFGQIEALPGHSYVVASRVSGRVIRVFKSAGERVQKGEPLVEIESRVVAEPPPRMTLVSERTGTLIRRDVEPGQPVEPEQSLLTVTDLSRVRFRADVFEIDLHRIAPGMEAAVRLEAFPDRIFEGTVGHFGPAADASTRTVPLWIELDNPEGRLRLNLRGRVRLAARDTPAVLAVPNEALLGDPAHRFVYLDDGARFVPTAVTIGVTDGLWTEVKSGLLPGDPVVTRGAYELQFVVTAPAPAGARKR